MDLVTRFFCYKIVGSTHLSRNGMDALTFPVSVFSFSVSLLESVSDSPLESDSGSLLDSVLKDGVCFINFLPYRIAQ